MFEARQGGEDRMSDEIDHKYTDQITCPYCGTENGDSWECMPGEEDLGNIECGTCCRTFLAERVITIEYCTYKIDWLKEWERMNHDKIQRRESEERYRIQKLQTAKNNREKIQTFIKENFQDNELKHQSTVTREMEPKLKYAIIDRYLVKVQSSKSLSNFIRFVNSIWDVEIFAEFDYLWIGYTDAFVAGSLQEDTNQVDKDFVTPALSAGADIQDKVEVV